MRSLLIFLALTAASQAMPYRFTASGTVDLYTTSSGPIAVGESFTASILLDLSLPDSAPGDPVLGRYFHTSSTSSIIFSGGFSLIDQPFEYRVVNSGYSPVIGETLDALLFDFSTPGLFFSFGFRFTPDTWDNDLALTPTLFDLTPDPVGGIVPASFNYYDGVNAANGEIAAFDLSPVQVPESSVTLLLLATTLPGLVVLARQSRRLRR